MRLPAVLRRKWLAPAARVLTLVTAGAGVVWLATFRTVPQPISNPMSVIPDDDALPPFRLPVLNARLFRGDTTWMSSDSLRGHVLLMNTWASWCGPCKAEMPDLMAVEANVVRASRPSWTERTSSGASGQRHCPPRCWWDGTVA